MRIVIYNMHWPTTFLHTSALIGLVVDLGALFMIEELLDGILEYAIAAPILIKRPAQSNCITESGSSPSTQAPTKTVIETTIAKVICNCKNFMILS